MRETVLLLVALLAPDAALSLPPPLWWGRGGATADEDEDEAAGVEWAGPCLSLLLSREAMCVWQASCVREVK